MTNEEAVKILNSLKPSISYGGRDSKTFSLMVTEALNKAIDALSETTIDLLSSSIKPLSGSFTVNWCDAVDTLYTSEEYTATIAERGLNVYHLAHS